MTAVRTRPAASRPARTIDKPAKAAPKSRFAKQAPAAEVEKTEPTPAPVKAAPPKVEPPAAKVGYTAPWAQWMMAARRADQVVGSRPVMPILTAVVIGGPSGEITARATNLDTFVESRLRGAYRRDGEQADLLVNARALKGALTGIRGTDTMAMAAHAAITVTRTTDNQVTVAGFGRVLTLTEQHWPAADFPKFPTLDAKGLVAQLDASQLSRAFGFAAAAAGTDGTLPMLTGVYIERDTLQPTEITFAGTDRYRLAATHETTHAGGPFIMLVPAVLTKLLGTLRGPVALHQSGAVESGRSYYAWFVSGSAVITTRQTDGSFPAWDKLVPNPSSLVRWEIDRSDLVGDIRAAQSVIDSRMPVEVDFGPGKVQVKGCEARVALGGAKAEWTTSFNPAFLLDALAAFDTPMRAYGSTTILIEGTSGQRPHVVRNPREPLAGFVLLMPVRVP